MKINLTIDRIEGDRAVLKTEDGQTIIWPKDKLPPGAEEKNVLAFAIDADEKEEVEKKNLAKNILNEILNP